MLVNCRDYGRGEIGPKGELVRWNFNGAGFPLINAVRFSVFQFRCSSLEIVDVLLWISLLFRIIVASTFKKSWIPWGEIKFWKKSNEINKNKKSDFFTPVVYCKQDIAPSAFTPCIPRVARRNFIECLLHVQYWLCESASGWKPSNFPGSDSLMQCKYISCTGTNVSWWLVHSRILPFKKKTIQRKFHFSNVYDTL